MILSISSLEPYWVRSYFPNLVSEIVDMLGEQITLRRTHEHHLHAILILAQLINWTLRALLDTAS